MRPLLGLVVVWVCACSAPPTEPRPDARTNSCTPMCLPEGCVRQDNLGAPIYLCGANAGRDNCCSLVQLECGPCPNNGVCRDSSGNESSDGRCYYPP